MVTIKIGDTLIEGVSLTVSKGLLGMDFVGDMVLEDLCCLFDTKEDVYVLDAKGTVTAVYKNHALTTIQIEVIGGKRRVSVVLQVAMGTGGADVSGLQAQVDQQAEQIAELSGALEAMEKGIGIA